jgi:hypothetical protein
MQEASKDDPYFALVGNEIRSLTSAPRRGDWKFSSTN